SAPPASCPASSVEPPSVRPASASTAASIDASGGASSSSVQPRQSRAIRDHRVMRNMAREASPAHGAVERTPTSTASVSSGGLLSVLPLRFRRRLSDGDVSARSAPGYQRPARGGARGGLERDHRRDRRRQVEPDRRALARARRAGGARAGAHGGQAGGGR